MTSIDATPTCKNRHNCTRHCHKKFRFEDPAARQTELRARRQSRTNKRNLIPRLTRSVAQAALFVGLLAFNMSAPNAQENDDQPVATKGDAVITGFSGTRENANGPRNVHPLDRTFIDGDGIALKVLDLSDMGGPANAQLASPTALLEIEAAQIGQVFATTLVPHTATDHLDIYAAATSFYGLHLVKDGTGGLERSLKGGPGARWMPGLFSEKENGGPGSIWKIDGITGAVSLFASVTSKGKPNAGPGIGGLAYDAKNGQIFAANLETGFIQRFDISGRLVDEFDHGETALWGVGRRAVPFKAGDRVEISDPNFDSENPATWGYAPKGRRVVALTVHDGRLYYSVAEGPEVWSVGIARDGGFASDARLEINLNAIPSNAPITKLAFDGKGHLYLSQRGNPANSYDYSVFAKPDVAAVLRYAWDDEKQDWAEVPDEFAVGLKRPYRASDGGVALGFGYDRDGQRKEGQCAATVWTTGSNLRDSDDEDTRPSGRTLFSGLQGMSSGAGEPLNASEPLTGSGALQGVVDYFFGGSETAPKESWFVAYHDALDGEERRVGHGGDVAIYAPCLPGEDPEEPEIAIPIDPVDPPIDPILPPGTPVVAIDKVCVPVGLGGTVSCDISITNTGTETPEWPIVFSDVSTIIVGPAAGTVTDITSALPDGPDWFCTPTPTQAFACALPGFALPPGVTRRVAVQLDTAGLINAGNFGFKNCATLDWPHAGQACDEGGRALKFEKTGPQVAVATGEATYTLSITNTGSLPFNGNVMLTDRLFISGAPVAVAIAAMNPDPQCLGGPPAAVPFSCIAPLTLAAGEKTSFDITLTLPADPIGNGYWVQNCFAVTDPGFGPPPGPPGPGSAQSCIWTEVLPTNIASNMRVDKTALNGAKCQKAGGDTIECDYEITLTNEGPVAFSDFVTLKETVPDNSTLTSGDPGLVCGGAAPDYTCNTGGSVDLANGASISFPMKLTMALPDLEAQGCEMLNRVRLTSPAGGTQANFKLTDDEATASADAFLQWWVGGMLFITCDPTNIKTEKVAKGPCIKNGASWRCDYDVTLTNLGPDPLTSVIKLKEEFSATPTALTFDAAWNCSGGGTTYTCEHPVLNLQKGDTLKFSVSAEVPDKGLCSLTNTASLTFPIAGTRGNSNGSDDTASALAKIPSKLCIKPVPEIDPIYPIIDPVPTCPDGSRRLQNGRCPCPRGETWSRYDQACVPKQCYDPERRKPNGKCCPRGTVWNSYFGACTRKCATGERWNPRKRRCESIRECPRGTEWNRRLRRCVPNVSCSRYERWSWSRLKCVPLSCKQIAKRKLPLPKRCQDHTQCGKNEKLRGDKCVCKRGYIRHHGKCVRKKRCIIPNAHYDYDQKRCVCDKGYRWSKRKCVPDTVIDPPPPPPPQCKGKNERKNRYGMCVCKRGYTRHKGVCVRKKRCIIPHAHYDYDQKRCVCDKGYRWSKRKCVPDTVIDPPPPPPKCTGQNERKNRYGMCVCKRGYTRKNGVCVSETTGRKCPDGKPASRSGQCYCGSSKIWNAKLWRCENSAPTACRANDRKCFCKLRGGTWRRGKCRMPTTPREECRKKGRVWKNGVCLPKLSDKERCKRQGKRWKNGRCVSKDTPSPIYCPNGLPAPKNGRCPPVTESPKQKCVARGGRWQRGRCRMPDSAAEKCRKQGKVWKNGRCMAKLSEKLKCSLKGKQWKNGRCVSKPKRPSPKEACRKKGWDWRGGTCKPKLSKQGFCALQGKVWRGGRCQSKSRTRPVPKQKAPKPKKPPVFRLQKPNAKWLKPKPQKRTSRARQQRSG